MTSIVIVEERDTARHMLARYCHKEGYRVKEIVNISNAPFFLTTCASPSIILVGVHFPGLASMGLLSMLAQGTPAYQRHRVIIIADTPSAELRVHAQTLTASMLTKPLEFGLLDRAIRAYSMAMPIAAGDQ